MTGKMTIEELFDAIFAKLEVMNELLRSPAEPLHPPALLTDGDGELDVAVDNKPAPPSSASVVTSSTPTPRPDAVITIPTVAVAHPIVAHTKCSTICHHYGEHAPTSTTITSASPTASTASALLHGAGALDGELQLDLPFSLPAPIPLQCTQTSLEPS